MVGILYIKRIDKRVKRKLECKWVRLYILIKIEAK